MVFSLESFFANFLYEYLVSKKGLPSRNRTSDLRNLETGVFNRHDRRNFYNPPLYQLSYRELTVQRTVVNPDIGRNSAVQPMDNPWM